MNLKNHQEEIDRVITDALNEDLRETGDVTTGLTVPEGMKAKAVLYAKENGILAGLPVFELVFKTVDAEVDFTSQSKEGNGVSPGETIATIKGKASSLLIAERTALNLLCRMSGIATLTGKYVEAIAGTDATILDTRKTMPGLRILDKYAVAVGGGTNHRIGLYDAILIKENHIAMGGGVAASVKSAKEGSDLPVQVEVENLHQLEEAINAGANSALLDNMTPLETKAAVELAKSLDAGEFLLESSGGITLENVREYAETGVDRISIGALTHSVKALDFSLIIKSIA